MHEEHVSVWDDVRDGWSAGPGRALRLATAEARLLTRRPGAFDALLVGCQQIHKQRSQVSLAQLLGDEAVARRVTTAAAAVREDYDPARMRGHRQITGEIDVSSADYDASLNDFLGVCRHADGTGRGVWVRIHKRQDTC